MTAQRGDFDGPLVSRRAPDLSPAERARLERIEAAPAADEDTVERVARAIWEAGREPGSLSWDELHESWGGAARHARRLARAAIAALKPAPGTDSSGRAVQRVLADLVEAVGRGDEVGLPEAYRAARALLRADQPPDGTPVR